MFALLDEHFEGVSRAQFDVDLAEKNWIVLVEDGETLFGFSTLLVYPTTASGQAMTVVCSGDTIVSPAAWRSMAFPRTWIHSVYKLDEFYPRARLIWLLLTSGYRTYRLLPVFWREFYPRFDRPTPPEWLDLLVELARQRFGAQFFPAKGIVRFARPQKLRGQLALVPPGRTADADIRFFLERNPGFAMGDELVCIADLHPDNLTRAGRRIVYGAA